MTVPWWAWLVGGGTALAVLSPAKPGRKWAPLRKLKRSPLPAQSGSYEITWVDGNGSLPSNPITYGSAVVMPQDVYDAWRYAIASAVVPFSEMAQAGLEPGERANIDVDAGKYLDWTLAFGVDRGVRDAFVFNTLDVGWRPDDQAGKKSEGEATTEEILEVASSAGKALGSVASVAAAAGGVLIAVGVPAGVVSSIMAASILAAKAGGFAVVAVAVMSALVVIAFAIFGAATGKTLSAYLIKGGPVTDDIRRAVAFRDKGGRLSYALDAVAVRDITTADQLGQTTFQAPEMKATGRLEGQRALENWVGSFLVNHWGLPWTPAMGAAYQMTKGKGANIHGFEWLGGSKTYRITGHRDPETSALVDGHWVSGEDAGTEVGTEGRRFALAIFAGLGTEEAAWLAKRPGTRGAGYHLKI